MVGPLTCSPFPVLSSLITRPLCSLRLSVLCNLSFGFFLRRFRSLPRRVPCAFSPAGPAPQHHANSDGDMDMSAPEIEACNPIAERVYLPDEEPAGSPGIAEEVVPDVASAAEDTEDDHEYRPEAVEAPEDSPSPPVVAPGGSRRAKKPARSSKLDFGGLNEDEAADLYGLRRSVSFVLEHEGSYRLTDCGIFVLWVTVNQGRAAAHQHKVGFIGKVERRTVI
jgi:hypothetical protein